MSNPTTEGGLSDPASFAEFAHMVTAAVVSLITEGWSRQSYGAMLQKLLEWLIAELDRIEEDGP